jgi:hypothetical protein
MSTEEKKPENPSAFPSDYNSDDGMTLRDYFANSAMQGLNPMEWSDYKILAKNAYEVADAMLKQRQS